MINKVMQNRIEEFKTNYTLDSKLKKRIVKPKFPYIGDEIYMEAVAAILAGKNLLLVGDKSTGKNILSENLAYLFNRPLWTSSFNVNIDSYSLIGGDSLEDGEIIFRPGPIYKVSKYGGFGVLDEINMAKNEAIAILHQILDYRRMIDIPGYGLLKLHPATRFIATMNYDYEGTRELNQALLSRFVIIQMPTIGENNLVRLIKTKYKNMKDSYINQFALLFFDLKKKFDQGELFTTSPDIRSLFDSFDLIKSGLSLTKSLTLTLVNKSFDPYERELIKDTIATRFEDNIFLRDVFND